MPAPVIEPDEELWAIALEENHPWREAAPQHVNPLLQNSCIKNDPGHSSLNLECTFHSDLRVDQVCTYGVLVYCRFVFLFLFGVQDQGPLESSILLLSDLFYPNC